MISFNSTWSILIHWIRVVIVRWQSDLVNTKKRMLPNCVKPYHTNKRKKQNMEKTCGTVHCGHICLLIQVVWLLCIGKTNVMSSMHGCLTYFRNVSILWIFIPHYNPVVLTAGAWGDGPAVGGVEWPDSRDGPRPRLVLLRNHGNPTGWTSWKYIV